MPPPGVTERPPEYYSHWGSTRHGQVSREPRQKIKNETSLFCKCVSWEKNWAGFKRKDGLQVVEVLAQTPFIRDNKAYALWRDFHVKLTGMLFVSAKGVKLEVLVSLGVFGTERHYNCPFRYCLGLKKFTKKMSSVLV